MRWTLFSSTWRCAWRRLRPTLAQNPLLALGVGAACTGVPVLAVVAGARLDARYVELTRDEAVLRSVALGLCATGLVAGAAVALLAPGLAQLGSVLEAAPISRAAASWSLTVAPVCVGGAALLVPFLLFALPLAGLEGLVLVAASATAAVFGAACGEGLRLSARLEPSGLAVLGSAVGLWALCGRAMGAAWYAGPAGSAAGRSSMLSALLLVAFALGGVGLWLAACAAQSKTQVRRRDVRRTNLPGRAVPAVAVATARRVVRHRELRLQAVAAVVLPVAVGASLGQALEVGGGPLLTFAVGLSITAAALLPAAAFGLGRDAGWLFGVAPRSSRILAGAVALGGAGPSLAVVAATALVCVPFARGDPSTYLELEGTAAFVLGCATFGGAAVPWRPDRLLQQLASYGSVIAVVVFGWLIVGRLEGVGGLDGTTFTLVVGNLALALGVAASGAIAR